MHKLLRRQIRRFLGDGEIPENLCALIAAVDEAYDQADRDRKLLEHSMDVVSDEHLERFRQLNEALAETRREADRLLRTKALMASVLESTADGVLVVDSDGRVVLSNRRFLDMWRIPETARAVRDAWEGLRSVLDQVVEPDAFLNRVRELHAQPQTEASDLVRFKDGRVFDWNSVPHRLDGRPVGRVWSFHDVTVRQQLEAQLHQAQKMDAVGQMAGGIAHDFNNIITAIGVHGDFLREALAPGDPRADDVEEIIRAGKRAAGLTRQLLAFSRRQILRPGLLDLNAVIAGVEPMLRRLITEDIRVRTSLAPSLGSVIADGGQLEQVIVNLAVNARDAMAQGGTLTISTSEVSLDEAFARAHGYPSVGRHALIAVTDTGCGVPTDLRERIFEPFFTTKEPGRGTGLGLSTVFGIVKQSGGCIAVDSEVGRGTTVNVWLPVAAGDAPSAPVTTAPDVGAGRETILLAEDEDSVRQLTQRILRRLGYRVLAARNGAEALRIAAEHGAAIDLLLTDVVMPELGGAQLVQRMRADRPGIRVVYMSGYTDDEVVRRGILQRDTAFVHKPFTAAALASAVREVLERDPVTAGPVPVGALALAGS